MKKITSLKLFIIGHLGRFLLMTVMAILLTLSACTDTNIGNTASTQTNGVIVQVFKRANCDCCRKWVKHIKAAGYTTTVKNTTKLATIKSQYNISQNYRSCHTAVTQGYVFEGHIPASIMQRFLAEKPPNAIGLAVPGMPIGSPGMEQGSRHDDYDVLLLKTDGSAEVYQHVTAETTKQNG